MEILTLQKIINKKEHYLLLKSVIKAIIFLVIMGEFFFSPNFYKLYSQEYIMQNNNLSNHFSSYYMYIAKNNAILRTSPSSYGFEIAILSKGEKVKVLYHPEEKVKIGQEKDYWYYVETEKKYIGWIFGSFLTEYKSNKKEEKITQEKISKELAGIWWEIDDLGNTGYRSIEFITDSSNPSKGKFIYKFQNTNPIEGEYEITNDGNIQLEKDLSIGKNFTFIETSDGNRIVIEIKNKKIYFRKAFSMKK